MEGKFEIEWRSAETDMPPRGVFVELAHAAAADIDRFGLNHSEKKHVAKVYWNPKDWSLPGLFWRFTPAPTFRATGAFDGPRPPIDEDFWYIVLTEPSQEVTTVWRLHEHGHELYVPIIRVRVMTGRTGRKGHKVTRLIPRPMFPGYGLIRRTGISDINDLLKVRGVRQLLRDQGEPIVLPHEAVLAVFRKQSDKHLEFSRQAMKRGRPSFKRGDTVKIEAEGSVYDGMLANVDKVDGKGRVEVLLGMAKLRHTLPAEMVVAA